MTTKLNTGAATVKRGLALGDVIDGTPIKQQRKSGLEEDGQDDDEEAILDLGEEASMSYNSLLSKPRTKEATGSINSKSQQSSLQADNPLPDYPSHMPFETIPFAKAQSITDIAFDSSKEKGWKVAIIEALKLELIKASKVYSPNHSAALAKMEQLGESMKKSLDRVMHSSLSESPKILPNPKNKDLATKYQLLKQLEEEYEAELMDWEKMLVDPPHIKMIVPVPQTKTEAFDNEWEDEELLNDLVNRSQIPKNICKLLEHGKRRIESIFHDIEQVKQANAALVNSYSQSLFDQEVNQPRMLIQTLATSQDTTSTAVLEPQPYSGIQPDEV